MRVQFTVFVFHFTIFSEIFMRVEFVSVVFMTNLWPFWTKIEPFGIKFGPFGMKFELFGIKFGPFGTNLEHFWNQIRNFRVKLGPSGNFLDYVLHILKFWYFLSFFGRQLELLGPWSLFAKGHFQNIRVPIAFSISFLMKQNTNLGQFTLNICFMSDKMVNLEQQCCFLWLHVCLGCRLNRPRFL